MTLNELIDQLTALRSAKPEAGAFEVYVDADDNGWHTPIVREGIDSNVTRLPVVVLGCDYSKS